jgi:16S rRNA processing protein RimM
MTVTPVAWVLLAHIVRPQGRLGEVLADIHTDFPESLGSRKRLFLRRNEVVREAALDAHWLHKGRVVLKFSKVDSINDAEQLRGFDVVIPPEDRLPLEDGAVYISDLVGAHVLDVRQGAPVDCGEIVDVQRDEGMPDMLVLRGPSDEELLIPFVLAYLRHVDLAEKQVLMDLPEGLLEAQRAAGDQGG